MVRCLIDDFFLLCVIMCLCLCIVCVFMYMCKCAKGGINDQLIR